MPANPDRRILISASTEATFSANVNESYRVIVTASDANLMPNEVFLYYRRDALPQYPDPVDEWQGVCTPEQLENLPITDPDPDLASKYFRLATIDKFFANPEVADNAINDIIVAVTGLKDALDFADGLGPTTEYWIGTPP